MNYWKLGKKEQSSIRKKFEQFMFRLIDVQSVQRNKLDSILVLLNYLMSYVIIFFMIMQCLGNQFIQLRERVSPQTPEQAGYAHLRFQKMANNDYKIVTVLLLVRVGLSVIYVMFQKLFMMILIKVSLIVSIFMNEFQSNQEEFMSIQLPLLFLELTALAVWAYKIQSRILHIDSRLTPRTPFFKQITIFFTAFLIKRIQKMTFTVTVINQWMGELNFTVYQIQLIQLLTACLGSLLFLDHIDILYNKTFKSLILSLDISNVALLLSWCLSVHLTGKNLPYFNYLILFGTLVVLQLVVLCRKQDFRVLYQIETRKLEYQSETQLIRYFQTLRRLIKSQKLTIVQKNISIIRFILFHRSTCLFTTCPFTKRYNMQDPVQLKCELIQQYILRSLQSLSTTRPLLKKYLIFYVSPKDKIFRYIDEKQSYMKRQIWRIKQIKKKLNNQMRILQAETTKKIATQLIESYLTCGKRFFDILLKENINCQNLIGYGEKMLDFLDKIEDMKANSTNFTQGVRVLINNFSTRLINDSTTNILETVIDPPFLIHKTTQTGPTMIVSAEPQNFLRIIDANIACTKQFYYPREVFLSLTVIDLLPDQIKVKHREHFDRVSKKTDFDGKKDFPISLFVINKNGYMAFFTAVVYLFNSIKGRKWCVTVQITHKLNAIVLIQIQRNGIVMGISEMAVFHGLKTTDKGKELTQKFYKDLTTKIQGTNKYKSVTVEPYEKIFENSDFQFVSAKSFEIAEQFSAFGLSYYLVQIRSIYGVESSARGRSSIVRSLLSLDGKHSSVSINESELNFVPKNQMFFHSDGAVRSFSQSPSNIFGRFDSLIQKNEIVQEEQEKGELGHGITQMRLIDQQLDFLQNIEQENEFMSKPKTQIEQKENQLNRFDLKIQFFEQCLKQRKDMLPKWLKYTRIYFIIIIILLIIAISTNFGYNSTRIGDIQDLQALLNRISENLINYVKISKLLMAGKYYDFSIRSNLKGIFDSVTKEIEISSQEVFGIDSTVQQYFSQDQIDKTISKYLIAFNNATLVANLTDFDINPMLNDLVMKITPSYNNLLEKKIQNFQTKNNQVVVNSFLLMLGFNILLVAILVWVWIVRLQIFKKKQRILSILSKAHDTLLQRQRTKLQLFQQFLYFDKDIFCQDDLDYIMKMSKEREKQDQNLIAFQDKKNVGLRRKYSWKNKKAEIDAEAERMSRQRTDTEHQIMTTKMQTDQHNRRNQSSHQQQQEGILYVKNLINLRRIKGFFILTMIWILCMGVLQYFFYNSINQFAIISQQIFRIQYNIQRMHSSSDVVWILLNYFPYNQQQLDMYEAEMYRSERYFKSQIIKMGQDKKFTDHFMQFYEEIWTQDCCNYIQDKVPSCRTVLNGALIQGADQIIAYLNRKYDFFMDKQLDLKQFYSNQVIKNLSNLELQYMTEIVKVNMDKLSDQHNAYVDVFQRELFIYFIATIIGLGCVGVIYKLLSMENQKMAKMERLFKLIDFDSLKDLKEFKLFFKENYHDKFYK